MRQTISVLNDKLGIEVISDDDESDSVIDIQKQFDSADVAIGELFSSLFELTVFISNQMLLFLHCKQTTILKFMMIYDEYVAASFSA